MGSKFRQRIPPYGWARCPARSGERVGWSGHFDTETFDDFFAGNRDDLWVIESRGGDYLGLVEGVDVGVEAVDQDFDLPTKRKEGSGRVPDSLRESGAKNLGSVVGIKQTDHQNHEGLVIFQDLLTP